MPLYDRSGANIIGYKLGRWRCVRQEMLAPGDRIKPKVTGFFRLGALREQLVMPVKVTMLIAVAPARWYDDYFVNAIKDPETTDTIVTATYNSRFEALGLGRPWSTIPRLFNRHYNAVYNWHLKWPQDADVAQDAVSSVFDDLEFGRVAVNLQALNTRMMDLELTGDDFELATTEGVGAREKFRLDDLAQASALLRVLRDREWRSSDRYHETLQDIYRSRGNVEVEKIPVIIGDFDEWANGQEIWATDSGSLGAVAGVLQGNIEYELPYTYVAPEHMVMSYHLCFRVPPVFAEQTAPWQQLGDWDWYENVADPDVLASSPPVQRTREYYDANAATAVGYEPAGQMWRSGWSTIDRRLEDRNTYMVQNHTPVSATQFRYHGSMDHAFRSLAIGHGISRLNIEQMVDSRVPLPMSSVMAGASL